MNFEYERVVIEDAGEPILPDTELFERTASERFEIVTGVSPWVVNDLVELRYDSILNVVFEGIELFCSPRREHPRPLSSVPIRLVVHHCANLLAGHEFRLASPEIVLAGGDLLPTLA